MTATAAKGAIKMHVIVRSYSGQGTSELFDALAERQDEVKSLMASVPGFISYAAFRSNGGGQTVTACQEKAGTDESTRRAAEWIRDNLDVSLDPPAVSEGSTVVHF
jgi:hypothetical protein